MKKNIILDIIEQKELNIIDFDNYGNEIAKINKIKPNKKLGKLIIVTAMNPTPVGEGKTTNSIGLVDILNKNNIKTIGVLREPSLGPVFGIKGTGSGSNKAILLPFDKINLHFSGDLHAITSANNLIVAVIENEIYQNSVLNIDPNSILWKRCMDINDRLLRDISYKINKNTIRTSFNITAASDLMALFCLANSIDDFKSKLENTIVCYTYDNSPVTIKDLNIIDAILTILQDAFKPNLVRTYENNPVLVHGGPFANIAHGCSSVISLKMGLQLADVVVTEAGFGSDLGLEKFMDIVCRSADVYPNLICLTISLKSILFHAQNKFDNEFENIDFGFKNVLHHYEHCKFFSNNVLVIINKRPDDNEESLQYLMNKLKSNNIDYYLSTVWSSGSKNSKKIANLVQTYLDKPIGKKHFIYDLGENLKTKIEKICEISYGTKNVKYSKKALEILQNHKENNEYVCIAKNPYSLSSDQTILNKPDKYEILINDINFNNCVNFAIPMASKIFRMPGLNKEPNAKNFKLK